MGKGFYSRGEIEQIVQHIRSPIIAPYRAHGTGKVFFVDVTYGSDSNPGDDPENALASITAALAKCVRSRDDYIIACKHWEVPHADAPITINKRDVHLIALGSGGFDSGNDLIAVAGDVAITISDVEGADGVDFEIAGFNIGGGGTVPAMHGGEIYRAHIHHCNFGLNAACTHGLTFDGTGSFTHSLIDHCIFGQLITGNGIYTTLNTSVIYKCKFRHKTGVGITAPAGGAFLYTDVIGNTFIIADSVDGEAITVVGAGTDNFFDDNVAAEGIATPTQNPYVESGVAGHWGRNYRGYAVVYPGD